MLVALSPMKVLHSFRSAVLFELPTSRDSINDSQAHLTPKGVQKNVSHIVCYKRSTPGGVQTDSDGKAIEAVDIRTIDGWGMKGPFIVRIIHVIESLRWTITRTYWPKRFGDITT